MTIPLGVGLVLGVIWLLGNEFQRLGYRLPRSPIGALTGAYLAIGAAWLLVLAYAILTRSQKSPPVVAT